MIPAMDPLFRPKSVAVIGASTEPRALGRQILQNILNYGFRGRVYPVNPKAKELLGVRCFPSVLDIPDPIDLAIVVVPRDFALAVTEECGRKGVRAVVVIVGPLLMFGLGGLFVETIRDVAFRPVPLTDLDARELIRAIRGYPILAGVRGQKPVDFAKVEEAILRLSQLISDFDCIEEVDINPFFASEREEDCKAADACIRLHGGG